MNRRFLDQLVTNRFRPKVIRKVLDRHDAEVRIQHARSKYVIGIHNGVFFRIKVPPKKRLLPDLRPIPTPQRPPKQFKEVSDHSRLLKQQQARDAFQEFKEKMKAWLMDNWTILILNFGSICTLIGFTRSDVLELRTLSVTGSLCGMLYNFTLTPFRWTPVMWSGLFASVNGWKIFQIMQERKATVHMTAAQEQVYIKYFMPHGITPKQFELIESKANVFTLEKGGCLIRQGDKLEHVYLVVSGSTRASILGRHLTAASTTPTAHEERVGGASGAWVGEIAFLESYWLKEQAKLLPEMPTDETVVTVRKKDSRAAEPDSSKDAPKRVKVTAQPARKPKSSHAMYTIVAKEDCKILRWSHADLEELLARSTDMRSGMTRAMTAAIVGKVINFTVSRSSSRSTWSTWLDDWKYSAGARVKVEESHKAENEVGDDPGENIPLYPIKKFS